MLEYVTAGESHGPQLTAIVKNFPSGVKIIDGDINRDLARRQMGYGRGGRMKIEKDKVEFLSGVRFGKTLGSPVTLVIKNRDYENWREVMNPAPIEGEGSKTVTRPRPGHADLAGCLKYNHRDARNILERSSARETAARVAVGALCRGFLKNFGIEVFSHVAQIADVSAQYAHLAFDEIKEKAEASDVRCSDEKAAEKMRKRIDELKKLGDTAGGIVEVAATGVPLGLGGVMNYDGKLDALLAQSLMSIQSVKGVEIGLGFGAASVPGSDVHDAIHYGTENVPQISGRGGSGRFYHSTNRAGGIEGGMSNGEPIIIRAAFKPIPTMMKPKRSVDLKTGEPFEASKERSDVCAVPAGGVVAESAVTFVLARAFMEKFGGDSLDEITRNYQAFVDYMDQY